MENTLERIIRSKQRKKKKIIEGKDIKELLMRILFISIRKNR
jgi:hypothetical protein